MSNPVITKTFFDFPVNGYDILQGIETHKVRGFFDVNFDGVNEVLISSSRYNDGPDKYNPTTPETLNPSGFYALDTANNELIKLPGLFYDARAVSILDIDKNGYQDIVIFDAGDEAYTHSSPVEGNNEGRLNLGSVGYRTSELLFTTNSFEQSELIDNAIYQYRKSDEELFGGRIESLSPFFEDDPSGVPDDIWKYLRPYNSIIFDFNGDGWDDIFVENGSSRIGPNQFIYDGKSRTIDPTFWDVWSKEYVDLLGVYQRFFSYSVVASNDGSIWIVGGTMREDEPEMDGWRNILMKMEHTPAGWVVHKKYALPLPGWAGDFISATKISIETDLNGDPRFIYLAHVNDQTNALGRFVGVYIQALGVDLLSDEITDLTTEKIPFQTKTSSLIKPDGTVNSVNNWADLNAKIAELDVNNDGFNDFVFTVGRITEYSQTIWINTGDGKFLPATDLYLNTDINWILPEHIADSDSDGLIEFWFAYQLISEPTFRIEVVEITDFRNDSIFGTLPVERHLSGFNGAYLLSILEIDPATINRDNYVSVFESVISQIDENIHMFAPGAKVHGFENVDDTIDLREGNETALGYSGNDHIKGNAGNDSINGGAGIDSAYFSGAKNQYAISIDAAEIKVTDLQNNRDGKDSLIEIERLIFSDSALAFDLDGNAGFIAKLLGAFLGADGINNSEYVGLGLSLIDSGMSKDSILTEALKVVFGDNPSGSDLVNGFYRNLTGETTPDSLLNEYSALIDSGSLTALSLANQVLEHEMNVSNIDLIGLASSGLEFI